MDRPLARSQHYLILCLCLFTSFKVLAQHPPAKTSFQLFHLQDKGINYSVDPRIELWQTVMLVAGNPQINGIDIDYKLRIIDQFGSFKHHALVQFIKKHAPQGKGIDKHSKLLISANIELFLNYCTRFYDRQFITRQDVNSDILEKFESLLTSYFHSEKPGFLGFPSVSYSADQLHLSANYFGDLIKKETGKTPTEYIHLTVLNLAKEKMMDPGKSISEIAYELGFKYTQHFTRFFKQQVGASPIAYRAGLN